jgi:hypothetical protein
MKTELHASTTDCGLCHKAHSGFRVKADSKGVQYVLCGSGATAKRVNLVLRDPKSKNPYQPGKWTIDK